MTGNRINLLCLAPASHLTQRRLTHRCTHGYDPASARPLIELLSQLVGNLPGRSWKQMEIDAAGRIEAHETDVLLQVDLETCIAMAPHQFHNVGECTWLGRQWRCGFLVDARVLF